VRGGELRRLGVDLRGKLCPLRFQRRQCLLRAPELARLLYRTS
jgi:hypothetical protein